MDISSLFPFDPELGYLGLGLVSFFGSLVPFVPVPSFVLLATMSVGDTFNLHVLAVMSALAATGAKQIIFYVRLQRPPHDEPKDAPPHDAIPEACEEVRGPPPRLSPPQLPYRTIWCMCLWDLQSTTPESSLSPPCAAK